MTTPTEPAPAPLDAPATVQRRPDTGAVVVVVAGEVAYDTGPQIRDAVLGVLAERPPLVVVDLLGVLFLGSAGLAMLAEAAQVAGSVVPLWIVAAGPTTLRPLHMTGFGGFLEIHPTVQDALAVLEGDAVPVASP